MAVSSPSFLPSTVVRITKVPAVEDAEVEVEEAAVEVPLDKTVSPEKVARRRRLVAPRLATNADRKVTSPEIAPTLLLRDPELEATLDVLVEEEPRDVPKELNTKAEIRLTVPVEEDVEAEVLAKTTGPRKVKIRKAKPLRNLPLTLREKAPLPLPKSPLLRNTRSSSKKSTRIPRPCPESPTKNT